MKLALILIASLACRAQDQPTTSGAQPSTTDTIRDALQQVHELREENAKLSKLLQAYQQQYFSCLVQAINAQALAPQPVQPAPAKEKQ